MIEGLFSIKEIQRMVHQNSVDKGFWEGQENIRLQGLDAQGVDTVGMKLALIHSEVSEALEDLREGKMETELEGMSGKPCGFGSELADVVIRILDLCGKMGIDMEKEIMLKHGFNTTRSHRHGGKKA